MRWREGCAEILNGATALVSEAEGDTRIGRPAERCEDTIVAISTAVGSGAIGIVRLSGPQSIAVVGRAFRPVHGRSIQEAGSFSLTYGHVCDPVTGAVIDESLVAVMRGPRSYTREDVVEVHGHGGAVAVRETLRLMVRLGARVAEPGEFTRRAFINGRIDLAQAESVAAIVGARSAAALRASVRQLDGGLSERLRAVRQDLVGVLAGIEASIDFSDEDVEEVDWESTREALLRSREQLRELLRTALLGQALERGLQTAIVGRPNAGKSSLLNALVMRERAIVSEIPGTTRDTVEDDIEIGGIPVRLVDTAGLRAGGDAVERLGIGRSIRAMEHADLVLQVVDISQPWDDEELGLVTDAAGAVVIVVANKVDLFADASRRLAELAERVQRHAGLSEKAGTPDRPKPWICGVSALTGEGVEELRGLIEQAVSGGSMALEEPMLASERQRLLVSEAANCLEDALAAVCGSVGEELVCEDVRGAAEALGRITGEELSPDVLDEVFHRFCLGK